MTHPRRILVEVYDSPTQRALIVRAGAASSPIVIEHRTPYELTPHMTAQELSRHTYSVAKNAALSLATRLGWAHDYETVLPAGVFPDDPETLEA